MLANNFLPVHTNVVFVIRCMQLASCDCLLQCNYSLIYVNHVCFINNMSCFNWNNDSINANLLYGVFTNQNNKTAALFVNKKVLV